MLSSRKNVEVTNLVLKDVDLLRTYEDAALLKEVRAIEFGGFDLRPIQAYLAGGSLRVWFSLAEHIALSKNTFLPNIQKLFLSLLCNFPSLGDDDVEETAAFLKSLRKLMTTRADNHYLTYSGTFVFLVLGLLAREWESTKIHRLFFNSEMLDLFWSIVSHSVSSVQVLGLLAMNTYITNFEKIQPPIFTKFRDYLHTALAFHVDLQVSFLGHWIARNTFGKPVEQRNQIVSANKQRTQKKKGKFYIEPKETLWISDDGLTVRNNTLLCHVATLPDVAGLSSAKWYWEFTAHVEGEYFLHYRSRKNLVLLERGESMFCVYLKERETAGVHMDLDALTLSVNTTTTGQELEFTLLPSSTVPYFYPLVQLHPFQQVCFNFGSPTVLNPRGGYELLSKYALGNVNLPPFVNKVLPTRWNNIKIAEKQDKENEDIESSYDGAPVTVTTTTTQPFLQRNPSVYEPNISLEEDSSSLRCPISRDVMKDPVRAADGQCYERSEIERWLNSHNTSPVTGAVLANKVLLPQPDLQASCTRARSKGQTFVRV